VTPSARAPLALAVFLAAGVVVAAAARASAAPSACPGSLPEVYESAAPAVVSIAAASVNPYSVSEPVSRVTGAGFIIEASGLVLTNSHLVFGKQAISVTLDTGDVFPAALVGADPVLDIAAIRIPRPRHGALPVAQLADSDRVRVGEEVLAIGNPLGLQRTLTRGIVSAVDRALPGASLSLTEPLIQTDAPMNPGNSGGPLLNPCGQVLGITTAIFPDAQNIGFAIPINLAKDVVPRLLADGRVIRPWLGVQGQLVSTVLKELLRLPLVDGILVEVVEPGSPAERIGLRGGQLDLMISGQSVLVGGDIITAIGGRSIERPEDLREALREVAVGAALSLTVVRGRERLNVDCVIAERPALAGDTASRRALSPAGQDRGVRGAGGDVRDSPIAF
jgi:putative serine protease PepD